MVADDSGARRLRYVVEADGVGVGERLDRFIARVAPELTRSQVQRLVDEGHVIVRGGPGKASLKLRAGDEVEVTIPPPQPAVPEPESIPLDIYYEDEDLIVVDKPAGMVVHPAPGHSSGTLVNALLGHCRDLSGIGGTRRPGIVHRIDKDTSGILVVTKTDRAHLAMARQFENKDPLREYVAFVAPPPRLEQGRFDTLHGRHPTQRKKFSSRVERGKRAVTLYSVVGRFGSAAARVRCRLETGRTHQIRVHFADAGMPLIGDPVYGKRKSAQVRQAGIDLGRQALHAQRLAFEHPVKGVRIDFESPLPDDLVRLQAVLEGLSYAHG